MDFVSKRNLEKIKSILPRIQAGLAQKQHIEAIALMSTMEAYVIASNATDFIGEAVIATCDGDFLSVMIDTRKSPALRYVQGNLRNFGNENRAEMEEISPVLIQVYDAYVTFIAKERLKVSA